MSLQPGTGSSGYSPPPSSVGRPLAPAPGVSTPELLIAKIRGRRPALILSAIALIAVAAAEAAIGLGLVIALNRNKPGAAVADITELQG